MHAIKNPTGGFLPGFRLFIRVNGNIFASVRLFSYWCGGCSYSSSRGFAFALAFRALGAGGFCFAFAFAFRALGAGGFCFAFAFAFRAFGAFCSCFCSTFCFACFVTRCAGLFAFGFAYTCFAFRAFFAFCFCFCAA